MFIAYPIHRARHRTVGGVSRGHDRSRSQLTSVACSYGCVGCPAPAGVVLPFPGAAPCGPVELVGAEVVPSGVLSRRRTPTPRRVQRRRCLQSFDPRIVQKLPGLVSCLLVHRDDRVPRRAAAHTHKRPLRSRRPGTGQARSRPSVGRRRPARSTSPIRTVCSRPPGDAPFAAAPGAVPAPAPAPNPNPTPADAPAPKPWVPAPAAPGAPVPGTFVPDAPLAEPGVAPALDPPAPGPAPGRPLSGCPKNPFTVVLFCPTRISR